MTKCATCEGEVLRGGVAPEHRAPDVYHLSEAECIRSLAARLAAVEARLPAPAASGCGRYMTPAWNCGQAGHLCVQCLMPAAATTVEPAPEKSGRVCMCTHREDEHFELDGTNDGTACEGEVPGSITGMCSCGAFRPLNPAPSVPMPPGVQWSDDRACSSAPAPSPAAVVEPMPGCKPWCGKPMACPDVPGGNAERGHTGSPWYVASKGNVMPEHPAYCSEACRNHRCSLNPTTTTSTAQPPSAPMVEPATAGAVSHAEAIRLLGTIVALAERGTMADASIAELRRYIDQREAAEKAEDVAANEDQAAIGALTKESESLRASLATREREVAALREEVAALNHDLSTARADANTLRQRDREMMETANRAAEAEARGRASALPAGAEEALREWRALDSSDRTCVLGFLGPELQAFGVAGKLLRALSAVPGGDGEGSTNKENG